MSTREIDGFVHRVMEQIPAALPERERIAQDLVSHLAETVEGAGSDVEAVRRMGNPESVARGYLDEVSRTYASVPTRVLAFLIDVALGFAIFVLIGGLIAAPAILMGSDAGEWSISWAPLVVVGVILLLSIALMSIAYFPLLEWQFGQTLGKRLLGIHVVQEDGRRITAVQAIVRRIPFFLEFFWIDAIVCLFTERKQRAFDLVARTIVTEVAPARSGVPGGVGQRDALPRSS